MKKSQKKLIESPELATLFRFFVNFICSHLVPFFINSCVNTGTKIKKNSAFEVSPPLSLELLRTYEGFENVSDEKGKEDIYFMETMANIFYSIYKQENKY